MSPFLKTWRKPSRVMPPTGHHTMPSTYNVSDTLYTYTYRMAGFSGGTPDYGLSAASGLFQSVVGSILLVGSNKLSAKYAGASLF